MMKFEIEQDKLSSGLRTVFLPRTETQSVTFLVLIGAGSRYETEKQWGLSHFLEHMFFKGTIKRPTTQDISLALDSIGADFNAFTDTEYTGYYVKVAKSQLELGADVVSDMLLNPLFPAEEIEREKGVIKEEIKMYTDNPMWHVDHLWHQALLGEHALGRRVDGIAETVGAFKRDDFVNYTNEHYHTDNVVVTVAGNFDQTETKKLLENLFADLSQGKETKPEAAPTDVPAERIVFESRPTMDQTHVLVGVPGLGLGDSKRPAAQVLAAILGGGMSSRLFLKVRERRGLAYSVHTSLESWTDTGSLVTQAGLQTESAVEAVKLVLEEYDAVMNDGVTQEEVDKVKNMVRGRMLLRLEETNALANFAGMQELLEKKIETPDELLKKIEAVTKEDVQSVAQELLVKEKRTQAVLGPQGDSNEFEALI